MRRTRLLLAAVLLAGATAGCSQEAADVGETSGYVAGDGSSVILPVDRRNPAPVLTGTDLDGESIDTADWLTWAVPGALLCYPLTRSSSQNPRPQKPASQEVLVS